MSSFAHELETLQPRKIIDDDDDDEDEDTKKPKTPKKPHDPEDDDADADPPSRKKPEESVVRRKNTIISLLCTNEPLAPEMSISFVASPDSCTYIFEARSPAACAGIEKASQPLGPAGVFGVIALIAILVYVAGGCVYQRTVMHQRGWRQLPNYGLWAGIWGFFSVRDALHS
jgi:cation-dependent mannose-6-phosphate receptor